MQVVFQAPAIILWIAVGIYVIAVPALLLKKGRWGVKTGVLVFITLVDGLLLFFLYRETKLTADDKGLYTNTYGEFSIKWGEIEKAFIINDLTSSEYKPTLRTNGASYGNTAFGWFALKNGKSARVVLESGSQCLAVYSKDKLYLFAPKNFEPFIRFVASKISVSNDEELQ